jgi:ATP-dependent helicase/nuclease subunit B
MSHDQNAMEYVTLSRGGLLDELADGAAVLTGNARLARHLTAEFGRRMLGRGHEAWSTPVVMPLDAWVIGVFDQLLMDSAEPLPRLLTPEQEQQVWTTIIAEEGPGLLRVDAAAGRASAAWRLVQDWKLDLGDRRFADNENGEAFRRWARRFGSICVQRGLVSEAELTGLVSGRIGHGDCRPPKRLLLAGFYDPAPALQELVAAIRRAGTDAEWVEITGRPGRARRVRAADTGHEIAASAAWARRILLENPKARIGIVVPDLAARRSALAHRLAKTLDPATLRPGGAPEAHPWNLSLGEPLSRVPIVRTALGLLGLMKSTVEMAALGVLLASPHWGLPRDSDERREALGRRARLDRRLRSIGDNAMLLSSICYQAGRADEAGQAEAWACPDLEARLRRLSEESRALPHRSEARAWASAFVNWLRQAGWPQGRPLDSGEFQAVESWNGLLSRFSGLNDFAGPLARGEALALLGRLAAETVFQPRAPEAPVQVLGLYEANALEFDHLWIMGLQDMVWPPPSAPDAFIPLALQRECGMPHCTPERQWAWAARMTAGLGASAPEVVYSWPGREGSEALACSPLIAAHENVDPHTLADGAADGWFGRIRASIVPEPFPGPAPIPLLHHEVPGGSRVFSHQAACPFRAFAEHRLGARPLDRPGVGLGPKRGGNLVHRVLEAIWGELQTHEALLALDDQALAGRVQAAVDEALEEQRRRSPVTLSPRYLAIEAERLRERVLEWLALERQRSSFRVLDREHSLTFDAGGLGVSLVLDRIDELEDGTRVVLDYKTGEARPADWFGERPHDAQLPLYGVASRSAAGGAAPAAVAFAQIRPEGVAFSGVVREGGILPGLPAARKGPLTEAAANWPAVLDEWADVLARLADAFRAGGAEVDPKQGLVTCRRGYCELGALCRIRERLAAPGDDIADDDDDEIEAGSQQQRGRRDAR